MNIESIPDLYKEAVYNKDVDGYMDLYDEDLRAFDMWEQWEYRGLDGWKNMATEWLGVVLGEAKDVVEFEDLLIEAAGEFASITAIVKFSAVSKTGETLRYLQNRLTWILRKRNGVWKITHQHTSGPVEANSGKVKFTKGE
jgi:ketosteroid isomerase-like protein